MIINPHPVALYTGLEPLKIYISKMKQTLSDNFAEMDSNPHNVKEIKSLDQVKNITDLSNFRTYCGNHAIRVLE
jgi:hypothetical protein